LLGLALQNSKGTQTIADYKPTVQQHIMGAFRRNFFGTYVNN
jgi:hypothetical protein